MKKKSEKRGRRDELRGEYDLSEIERRRPREIYRTVSSGNESGAAPPDVAEYFPDEQAVNTALRTLIRAAKRPRRSKR